MRTLTPIALSLSFVFAVQGVQAQSGLFAKLTGQDDGVAAGLDMMRLNTSLLRNGDNVWERAREGFQLREVNPELVRRTERQYAANPQYFKRILERSHKYLFHIMNEVERRGMPTEIALLPVVESAFNPVAQSNVGASGLWQFMPTTGRQYGLEQTWWYDGRRDVLEATRAALDYLQNLHAMFGDWTLALAAYNWGEGNLARSIAKTRARGEAETYENINMPAETRNYVPKLIAVRNILANPASFGVKLERFPNKPYFVAVSTGKHIDLDLAAKLAETPLREFKELNAAYNLPVAAYKNGRQVLVPADKLSRFEANLAKWDKPLLNWQVVTPSSSDSLQAMASRYDMSTVELINANNLRGGSLLPGRPLLVAARKGSSGLNLNPTPLLPAGGDLDAGNTLLAQATPTTVMAIPVEPAINTRPAATLVAANVVAPAARKAVIAEPVATVAPVPAPIIAAATPAPAVEPMIVAATQPAPNAIETPAVEPVTAPTLAQADSTIAVPANVVKASETETKPQPSKEALRLANANNLSDYTVSSGDTLFNISRRYELTVAELKTLNNLSDDTVKLGQVLKVKSKASVMVASRSAQDDAVTQVAAIKPEVALAAKAVPVEYVVQSGDTLFSIARKFGVRHTDVQSKSLRANHLTPGQRVWIQGL